jgi:hypothetical protein
MEIAWLGRSRRSTQGEDSRTKVELQRCAEVRFVTGEIAGELGGKTRGIVASYERSCLMLGCVFLADLAAETSIQMAGIFGALAQAPCSATQPHVWLAGGRGGAHKRLVHRS